jgi:hypothetical protein
MKPSTKYIITILIIAAPLQICFVEYKDYKLKDLREKAIKNHSTMDDEFEKEYPKFTKFVELLSKYH